MATYISYLVIGIALILIVEGAIYAAAPEPMKRLIGRIEEMPTSALRSGGLIAVAVGFVIMFVLR